VILELGQTAAELGSLPDAKAICARAAELFTLLREAGGAAAENAADVLEGEADACYAVASCIALSGDTVSDPARTGLQFGGAGNYTALRLIERCGEGRAWGAGEGQRGKSSGGESSGGNNSGG
jgi:hypothetical protein